MTSSTAAFDLKSALQDPASSFKEPTEVLTHPGLSREQRLRILRQWEWDARGLAVAEEEGMIGGEESMLSRVRRALTALGDEADDTHGTTKHGG